MRERFRTGGREYTLKSNAPHELVTAVRTVNNKRRCLSQRFRHSPGGQTGYDWIVPTG